MGHPDGEGYKTQKHQQTQWELERWCYLCNANKKQIGNLEKIETDPILKMELGIKGKIWDHCKNSNSSSIFLKHITKSF